MALIPDPVYAGLTQADDDDDDDDDEAQFRD